MWVDIVLARDGTVLDARIQRSSGFPLIDQAILDMVHSASPVPPLPAEHPGAQAQIGLPFNVRLGLVDRLF